MTRHPSSLLSNAWSRLMPEQISDGAINIWLDPDLPRQERRYARKAIRAIDEITGMPIRLGADGPEVDIRVQWGTQESYASRNHPNAMGLAYFEDGIAHATWHEDRFEAFGYSLEPVLRRSGPRAGQPSNRKRLKLNSRGQHVIFHELLHTFGLSHPENDGKHLDWKPRHTLMTCRSPLEEPELSRLDIAALQQVWGSEPV